MIVGLLGRKVGMTRIFTEDGVSVPVSVVEAKNNRVVQVKSPATDAYSAVQVAVGERKAKHATKAVAGHYAKNKIELGRRLREFRLAPDHGLEAGHVLCVDQFQAGQIVDVTGTTKGKGFAGTVKRHNFRTQDATHGNSLSHRAPGSSGQNQSPGRVFKGKRMSGHMGDVQATIQNLEVVRVDAERSLLLIKGAIPGAPGGEVIVKLAVKTKIRPGAEA